MANIKSQKKRILTNEKARQRNKAIKSELKTATRRVRDAVAEGNGAEAYAAALAACRLMDKAVSKGVIKKNQAANRKSGIMLLANTIVSDEDRAAYKKVEGKKPTKGGKNKKAANKKKREEEMRKAQKEKDKRRAAQSKSEEAANKRKAKEAKEAAKAEAEAAKSEAEATEEAPAEESAE